MDKRQFLEQTIDTVRSLNIADVIGRYIDLPKRVSSSYLGLCPFHNDTRLGSFVVTPKKGIFKCFSCGEGGDAAKFVALYNGLNYVEAIFEIALQERIISYEEYEEYFKRRRYTKKEVEKIEKIYVEKDRKKFESDIADINTRDKVFNIFLDSLKLKKEHKEYLNTERQLSDEIIARRKYKSCQYATDTFMKDFLGKLNNSDVEYVDGKGIRKRGEEVLEHIPGFYKKKSKGKWQWTFPYNKGIFIPIRNAKGKIAGLQIRRDKKDEHRGRYFWFSSSFAQYNDKYKYGVSSGSPMDVLYPDKEVLDKLEFSRPTKILFITEGRFKSEAIIKKIASVSISVQGVGNWKGIDKVIKKAEKQVKEMYPNHPGFERVYVAYDSDMSYKYQVYEQLKKMTDYLRERTNLKLYYLHWTDGYKGIDDTLLNSNCKSPRQCGCLFNVYDKTYWDEEYARQLKEIMEKKGVKKPQDLSQDDLVIGINIKPQKKSTNTRN